MIAGGFADDKRRPGSGWLAFVALVVLALIAFCNSFPASFHGDDLTIVRNNPLVEHIDLQAICTTDYWGQDANSGLFRPLTILSFGLNRLFLGPSASAFHAVNLLLHALVSVMLFLALRRNGFSGKVAWLAAALFAVHPVHTEVVNEAVGRAELLAALGLFTALWAAGGSRSKAAWALTGLAYIAALLSKESAVALLPALILLDRVAGRWQQGKWRDRILLYGFLTGITCLWLAWRTWGVVRAVPKDAKDLIYTPLAFMPVENRVTTALSIQWQYLWKQLFPLELQGIYSGDNFFRPIAFGTLSGQLLLLATLFLLAWAVWAWCRSRSGGAIVLAYAVAFLPTSNLLFATGVTMAERLAYFPSAWFCTGMAALLFLLHEKLPWRRLTGAGATAVLAGYLLLTLARNPAYASPVTLWRTDVENDPRNVLAWMYLANSYADQGNDAEADWAFRYMADLAPGFTEGLRNYAGFLLEQKRYDESIAWGLKVAADPLSWSPHNAMVLAQAYYGKGDYPEALHWLELARPLFQKYGIYWEVRGRALEGMGQLATAVDSYRRMGDYPAGSEVPLRLGHLLLQLGRHREAAEVLLAETERNPGSAAAWNSLGIARALGGETAAAGEAFRRAVSLAPGNEGYRDNLLRAAQSGK